MKAVILAAGNGMRIGNQLPKCLMKLPSGKTIIENQLEIIRGLRIKEIIIVVGFKKEIIMEQHSDVVYRYNQFYHVTNTAKSLAMALGCISEDDLVWINGDVALEPEVMKRVVSRAGNIVAVNSMDCDDEAMKYELDSAGKIKNISKDLLQQKGEAVGVNKLCKKAFLPFLESLEECGDRDYFEKAIEFSIRKGTDFYPVDISDCKCVEIDFKEDFANLSKVF